MENITFRSLTPIFKFTLGDNSEFLHSGTFKDASYSISLRKYAEGKPGFDELMRYADEISHEKLRSIHLAPPPLHGVADYFLVVDVTQSLTEDLRVNINPYESVHISNKVLDALRLHSSKGLLYCNTYLFRFPHHPQGGQATSSPLINQFVFSHLGTGLSVLYDSEFENCLTTFDILVNKKWDNNIVFDRILSFALRYHQIIFNLEAVEHAFLILMVIFESLFKDDSENNASNAANRISRLLSIKKNDYNKIRDDFNDNDRSTDPFCHIRNKIVHGDPTLDTKTIKSKYPALYQYITKAIIKLISLPDGTIDHTKNYYEEINNFVDEQFSALPAS
jgi:hypothetical protein